jgi:hypothetical protein
MSSQVIRVDGLRTLAAGSITATYVAIGTVFKHPIRLLKVVNNTNADILISYDGVNDNDFIPASSFYLYDGNTNKNLPDSRYVFQPGTTIYARSTGSPSTGSIYAVCLFGQGE